MNERDGRLHLCSVCGEAFTDLESLIVHREEGNVTGCVLPPKRKGAAAEDTKEVPPVKKSKEAEETPENSKAENVEAIPKEARGAFLPRTMKRRDYYEEVLCAIGNCQSTPVDDDFPQIVLTHTEEFTDFDDFFTEGYKEALKAGYDAYFVDEIASGEMKNSDEWWKDRVEELSRGKKEKTKMTKDKTN